MTKVLIMECYISDKTYIILGKDRYFSTPRIQLLVARSTILLIDKSCILVCENEEINKNVLSNSEFEKATTTKTS